MVHFLLSCIFVRTVEFHPVNINICRKTETLRRHFYESRKPATQSDRDLLEMTETERTGFPPARE
ncbi:hypothetical protein E4W17_03025 [Neisseria meningitidis]|nr:hypothetical protein [Neisseria meningitidis]